MHNSLGAAESHDAGDEGPDSPSSVGALPAAKARTDTHNFGDSVARIRMRCIRE